jgi:hypothetical protein
MGVLDELDTPTISGVFHWLVKFLFQIFPFQLLFGITEKPKKVAANHPHTK